MAPPTSPTGPTLPATRPLQNLPGGRGSSLLRGISGGQSAISAAPANLTIAQLNALSYRQLADYIASTNTCVYRTTTDDFFTFNADTMAFYQDQARFQFLLEDLRARCRAFTGTDDRGIPGLVEVIRAGYFLAAGSPKELAYLNTPEWHNKCLDIIRTAQACPEFKLATGEENFWRPYVVKAIAQLMSNGAGDAGCMNAFVPLMRDFYDTWQTNIEKYKAYDWNNGGSCRFVAANAKAIHQIMAAADFELMTRRLWYVDASGNQVKRDVKESALYHQVDPYLDEVFRLMSFGTYDSTKCGWLIDSAAYYAGNQNPYYSAPARVRDAMVTSFRIHHQTPGKWQLLDAGLANNLLNKFSCDLDGNPIADPTLIQTTWSQVQEEIREQYLPVRINFDSSEEGSYQYTCRAGAHVSLEKIKKLIWAHKETRAQFLRAIRTDKPRNPEVRSDETLTLVIYNSPDEYKMNSYAWGMDTQNGGLYIEGMGTFFTYERTTAQSIYSLEELFRHEGVHYLQGRFLEPGSWGSALYAHDRLTWLDEGGAEFFAGSTRTEGVKPRGSMTINLATDPKASRYTVDKVLHSAYSGDFTFYRYAWAFYEYLYNTNQFDTWLKLADALQVGDATTYDAQIAQMSRDGSLNAGYQTHLQWLLDNAGTFTTPSTADAYTQSHPRRSAADVYADIKNVMGLRADTPAQTTTTACDAWNTFTFRGSYAAQPGEDWSVLNQKADEWLHALAQKPWSGYQTVTCYFANPTTDAQNRQTWDVVFHGVLSDAVSINKPPVPVLDLPRIAQTNVSLAFRGSGSSDPDGQIVSWSWDFGDGTKSSEKDPVHTYTQAQTYTVALTVTDDRGAIRTTRRDLMVTPPMINGFITAECEPNNSPATASGPMGSGIAVTGQVGPTDNEDYLYFDVTAPGEVGILCNTIGPDDPSSDGYAWSVYHSSNLNYGGQVFNKGQGSSFPVTADKLGRYIIHVYSYGPSTKRYTFTLKGALGGGQTAPVALISGPTQGEVGQSLAFSGSGSNGTSLSYFWNFGDGATSSLPNPSHAFQAAGSYPVALQVTNAQGVSSAKVSQMVTIKPSTVQPSISLSVSAANGSATCDPHVTGAVSSVTYWVDSNPAVSISQSPFRYAFNTSGMTPGSTHRVFARANTAMGASVDSGWMDFNVVGPTQPALNLKVLTAPGNALVDPGANAAVTSVTYWVDDNPAVSITQSPFQYSLNTSQMTPGSTHRVLARANTATGASVDSGWVTFNVVGPTLPTLNLQVTTAPGFALVDPGANTAVSSVTYWVDNLPAVSITQAPFTYKVNTAGMAGGSSHSVLARAYSISGASVDSGWVAFKAVATGPDTQAPVVSLVATPEVTGGKVTLRAAASDNVGIAKVIFYIDTWTSPTTVSSAPWTTTVTGLSKGTHYAVAEARDAANNVAYSTWVSFLIP